MRSCWQRLRQRYKQNTNDKEQRGENSRAVFLTEKDSKSRKNVLCSYQTCRCERILRTAVGFLKEKKLCVRNDWVICFWSLA